MPKRGDRVDVRTRFAGAWATGYEVVEAISDKPDGDQTRYRVRRMADGRVLPVDFNRRDVRSAD